MKTKFLAYAPALKPARDGGFVLELNISESEWEAIKDLNNPILKQYEFVVQMEGESMSNRDTKQFKPRTRKLSSATLEE